MNQNEHHQEDLAGIFISQLSHSFTKNNRSPLTRYFYLYFLHLLGKLNYREENGEAVFFDQNSSFRVSLPVIDSAEKYLEIEKINSELAEFVSGFKEKMANPPLNFIQDLE